MILPASAFGRSRNVKKLPTKNRLGSRKGYMLEVNLPKIQWPGRHDAGTPDTAYHGRPEESCAREDSHLRRGSSQSQAATRYQFGNYVDSVTLELDDRARILSYEEYYPMATRHTKRSASK